MALRHYVWLSKVRQINLTTAGSSAGFVGFFFWLCMMNICCPLLVLANPMIHSKCKKRRRVSLSFKGLAATEPTYKTGQVLILLEGVNIDAPRKWSCRTCPQPCAFQLSPLLREQSCLPRRWSPSPGEKSR